MLRYKQRKSFKNVKTASFQEENWRFWSGLRDLNPRSPGPKPGAIPNFAKPGYSIGVFGDVVKHVVKGYFRPEQGRSQAEKVLALQRVFGLGDFTGANRAPAPKPGALPTGPHPDMNSCSTRNVLYTKNEEKAIISFCRTREIWLEKGRRGVYDKRAR